MNEEEMLAVRLPHPAAAYWSISAHGYKNPAYDDLYLLYVASCRGGIFMPQSKGKLRNSKVKRLVTDALLAAMFFALSMMSIEIAGLKFTLVSLPTVICAMMYGPVDAMIVGLLGAFMEQMLGYGLTATTALWIMPAGVRAFVIGMGTVIFRDAMSLQTVLQKRRPYVYFAVCITAGIMTSLSNTLVYYIDSKLFGYYSYALVFGVLGTRLLSGIATAVITAILAIPVLSALKRAGMIGE